MFSVNKWLKTPDVDGRYQPIVRDFQAAIPEVLDALPTKCSQQPASLTTLNFQQFDDVSLMRRKVEHPYPAGVSTCYDMLRFPVSAEVWRASLSD